ncbi:hypothetical protein QOZ80_3BG0296800 [Eleusine coracana subsp. coracana]|nr:hypothetical protein QOZ80_3BG0296800 [Eleusine coracana subsp. coracana]
MAFYARRSLATALSRHFSRRLHPYVSHLLPPDHNRSEKPSTSSSPFPPQPQPALPRPSRSHALPFALHLAAQRNFSTTSSSSVPEIDAQVLTDAASTAPVSELLSDEVVGAAASSVPVPPAPYAGEVAAAAADSFAPVAALQHLMDVVHSFTGLNWWVCIALTTVLIRLATVPLLLNQLKSMAKMNALRPEIEAIKEEMQNSTDPGSLEVGKQKLGALFLRHGVTPLTPLKGLFIQGPIFLSFFFAISDMVDKVPSLKGGGTYWFTDLTTPDDLFILPVLMSLSFLATVELNMQDGMEGNPMLKQMKSTSRVFGVLLIPFAMSFPKALFFYWITSNLFSLGYGAVIRKPAIRNYLNLPPLESQQPTPPQMHSFNSLFSGPKSISRVDAPKECERSSSALSHRIKELEDRAKSRGESQE